MFSWMYDYPTWLMALVFAFGWAALGLGGMFLVRPIFHRLIHGQERVNEMVSLNIASFSLFYAIMLGLAAVGVYTQYVSTGEIVEREASALAALYSDTNGIAEPARSQLLADLRAYAKETIEGDWPTQSKGAVPSGGTERLVAYQDHLSTVHPADRADQVAYAAAFGQFEKLVELRSTRLDRVTAASPALIWWIVVGGGLLTIAVVWMLDMQIIVHGILTAVLSMFLGIVFFFIADMDRPFRGQAFVGPDAYELTYQSMLKTSDAARARAVPANPGAPTVTPISPNSSVR